MAYPVVHVMGEQMASVKRRNPWRSRVRSRRSQAFLADGLLGVERAVLRLRGWVSGRAGAPISMTVCLVPGSRSNARGDRP
jgi:hypothetical protein